MKTTEAAASVEAATSVEAAASVASNIVMAVEYTRGHLQKLLTRSPATAGKANRSLLFLEHRVPMPELFTKLRFSVLREFWTQEIRLPLSGDDAPRLG